MSADALPDSPDADRRRYAAAAPVVEGFIDNLIEFYRGGELALPNITQLLWARDRLVKSRERATITVAKARNALTQGACEAVLLRCTGCGSSLSLLDGGTCHYCGRKLDLWRLDWMVTGLTVQP
jgi:hypothetical protein